MGVVEGALADVPAVVDQRPGRSRIIGTEQPAVLGFDDRVDAIGVGARNRHADLADHRGRQARTTADLGPGLAAVGRLEETAAGTSAGHRVLDPERFPQSREHDVRVVRIDRDVDAACLGVAKQLPLPGLAAVGALEDAALFAGHAVFAERRDEDDVRVGRMDADLRDRLRLAEADVRPRLAGVRRLVDAVAGLDVAADARLPHPDEHDVRIGFRDRDRADRTAVDLPVRHRKPALTAVDRLPQAAAGLPGVGLLGPPLDAADRDRSSCARRTDATPLERLQHERIESRRGRGRRRLRRGLRLHAEHRNPGHDQHRRGADREHASRHGYHRRLLSCWW